MTEDEAKTKWCPMARVKPWQEDSQTPHNREGGGPYDSQGMETPVINGSSYRAMLEASPFKEGTTLQQKEPGD